MGKRIRIKVEFLFEGLISELETQNGVLFGDKVLVIDEQGYSLYNAKPTDQPDVYIVDLDNDGEDFINCDHELLIDLIVA
jgi:hypothetical protein